jgi:hypothetical protein
LNLAANDSTVGFQLGFAGTAKADTAADTGQVGPHPGEPGKQVLQLRQLDLELGLVASRASGEDVENHFRPVHDPDLELTLEVGTLNRRQLFVEDYQRCIGGSYFAGNLLDLAFADQGCRIRRHDVLGDPPHHLGPGRVHQPGQLFQMFGDMPGIG